MILPLLAVVLASPTLPQECEPPPARDVAALAELAKKSGAVSVGLDSVATWCFDSGGTWTGGQKPKKGKAPDPDALPTGDCAKAIGTCEGAKVVLTADLRGLLADALQDIDTPYLGVKYTPRRSGLAERPTEAADCRSHNRSELFAQAQARMDIARLANQAQSEYRNFRTWLFKQSLTCAAMVARGEKDITRRGIAIDTPVQRDQGAPALPAVDAGAKEAGSTASSGTVVATRDPTTVVLSKDSPSGAVVVTRDGQPKSAVVVTRDPPSGGVVASKDPPSGGVASKDAPSGGVVVTKDAPSGAVVVSKDAPTGAVVSKDPSGAAPSGTTVIVRDPSAATKDSPSAVVLKDPRLAAQPGLSTKTPDTVVVADPARTTPPAAPVGDLPVGGPTQERQRALASSMLIKWRYLADQRARLERDPDWVQGFLNSRELRDCRCVRTEPKELLRRLEAGDRVAELELDDDKLTRCELCLEDAYPPWKARVLRQCAQMDELTDFELGVLQRSDDGNGLPPACFEASRARRATRAPVRTTQPAATSGGRGGAAFIITKAPDPAPVSPIASAGSEQPTDYAPIPPRENGRVYYRVFMSRACVAEVEPGPIQARTGDLMPIPPGAEALTVRSPCGGMVEVYWGREEKPRVSEVFGKNQPLRLQFRRP